MEGLLNLLPIYIDDEKHQFDLEDYLETCRVHESFDVHDVNDAQSQHALGVMNSKLNDAETRIIGAKLLDVFVSQCGTDVFTSHCVSWTQQVLKLLQGSHTMEGASTACRVMRKLVAYSSQFSDVSRQLSTSIISQLVTALCDEKHQKMVRISEAVLECLKDVMEHYHSACGPLKGTIERFLLSFVDLSFVTPESNVQLLWAECFAVMPRLGGSGNQGNQHKANWIELYSKVLGSLQRSVDNMLKHIDELKVYQPIPDCLKIPELANQNPMVLLHSERRRFLNLCTVLIHQIKDTFTTTKTIAIDQLLEVISRLVSFNSKSLTKSAQANFERLSLAAVVPELQMAALELLTALISVCRGQLITRASIVTNYFVQILQWTFTPVDRRRVGTDRPYGKLRIKAYQTLSVWLTVSRSACCFAKHSDAIFTQLLSDVAVHRDTVQLMTATSQQNSGGKKGKKVLDTPTLIVHKVDAKANVDVCRAALQCLSTVLLYCGARIKPATHKETQEAVLSLLIDIMRGVPLKAMVPFNDPGCRAGLYSVLQKLILCPNPQFPAPLNYASAIFNIGLSDPCIEVSNVCAEGLVSIQGLVRPRGPTLNFALERTQVKSAIDSAPLMSSLTYSKQQESQYSIAQVPLPDPVAKVAAEAVLVAATAAPAVVPETPSKPTNYGTPPSGVSTIVTESPASDQLVMTRKEALKVITSINQPKEPNAELDPKSIPDLKSEPKTPQSDKPSIRKRAASPVATAKAPQEKILKELPYGTDEVDDDLEAMLASFKDVPAE